MEFHKLRDLMQKHIANMVKNADKLFVVDVDGDKLYQEIYLGSFPEGTNNLFRKKNEYECSSCRRFIKSFGPVVTIKNGVVTTAWDFVVGDPVFQVVVDALSAFVKSLPIAGQFITVESKFGTDTTYETVDGNVLTWHHLACEIPAKFVYRGKETVGETTNNINTRYAVFKRALDEVTEDSVATVLELIAQGLYKGAEYKRQVVEFQKLQTQYKAFNGDKSLWAWEKSATIDGAVAGIRGSSIGTLMADIAEGVEMDDAVKKYGFKVDPENYKHSKAVFTEGMLKKAKETVAELGLMESLPRRFAVLGDIGIDNVLFANRDVVGLMADDDPFASLAKVTVSKPKAFNKVDEVTIDKFVSDILPLSSSVEVMFEHGHIKNLVSLIAPVNKEAPSLFKWDNGFSWAYKENLADSAMKEKVVKAGGKVNGVLRCSISWNEKGDNNSDYDLHCIEPNLNEIDFRKKEGHSSGGNLDVDIMIPFTDHRARANNGTAVENITWPDKSKMQEGIYTFFLHVYTHSGRTGFAAEIEFEDGQIFNFEDRSDVKGKVAIAKVEYTKAGGFKMLDNMGGTSSCRSTEAWGLTTGQFYPVSVVSYSPNFWDGQKGIGHQHYFFMLKGCVNNESPNGFFNEFLRVELEKHRKVFEALGSQMHVADSENQLSGLGFSASKPNTLTVKVQGQTTRVLKVLF